MTSLKPFLLALAATASLAASAQPTHSPVETRFVNPGRYTDFRLERTRGARDAAHLADELRAWMEREAPRHLPAGSKLVVTFTDVDMAGEFEPFVSSGMADVRVVRDIYPARVSLAFSLSDESGKVVKEGERKLVSAFVYGAGVRNADGPLRHEKTLLQEWLAREFATPR